MNRKFSVRKMASAAVIAAVYAGLTMFLAPISYGPIQLRVSEVLCILPFFFPSSTWGLFVGCILANLLSAYGIIDVVFGSAATLFAALTTMMIGKRSHGKLSAALACLPPVFFNGIFVGAAIAFTTTDTAFWQSFLLNGLQVAGSELVVMYLLGFPLAMYLPKTEVFKRYLKY